MSGFLHGLVVAAFTMLAFVAAPVQAGAVSLFYGASGNGGEPTTLEFDSIDGHGSRWQVEDTVSVPALPPPLEVYHDPGKGPLRKSLLDPNPDIDGWYTVVEYLHVNQGQPWTDWHEKLVDPGWVWWAWEGTPVLTTDTELEIDGVISEDGRGLSFSFPPLEPGTYITITKQFAWKPVGEIPFPDSVVIDEWPTVPEPGTIVLLASGLLGLLCHAWRKRK